MRGGCQDGGKEATAAPGRARGRSRGHRNTTLSGDTRVDWSEAFALVPSLDVGYVWHAGVHAAEVAAGLKAIGFEIVSQVIWDKGLFAMGRSWYHWSHEPCWVIRKKGARVRFLGSRDQATIWRVPSPKMIMAGSKERKHDHPTQKPALLFELPIRNHTKPGEAVYDPFLGSGTTLIAAERHARVCYGLEVDPRFCDVVLARWERFTAKAAGWSMDESLMRMLLELPLRERIRREHRCPPSLDDPRLAEAQADLIVGVIREVLDSLDLTPEQHERGLDVAAALLRRAAGEDRHDDPIASNDGGYQAHRSYQR